MDRIYSIIVVGFLSFIVWAHHMFLTGMGTSISAFFQTTTMILVGPNNRWASTTPPTRRWTTSAPTG